jgi:hypothetical protein
MTENGLDIQNISTKRLNLKTDRVLLFGRVTEKKEKANLHCTHLVLSHSQANPSQNQKSVIFANPLSTSILQYGDK